MEALTHVRTPQILDECLRQDVVFHSFYFILAPPIDTESDSIGVAHNFTRVEEFVSTRLAILQLRSIFLQMTVARQSARSDFEGHQDPIYLVFLKLRHDLSRLR